jgi:hypothetical protein
MHSPEQVFTIVFELNGPGRRPQSKQSPASRWLVHRLELSHLGMSRFREHFSTAGEKTIDESGTQRFWCNDAVFAHGQKTPLYCEGIEAGLMNWKEQVVLVTGGTGSFGRKFVEIMLREYHPKRLVIFSRDELKQHDMRGSGFDHPSLRYFIGDVRDAGRLQRAFSGVTVVVHAAALKQVPACEYNPF